MSARPLAFYCSVVNLDSSLFGLALDTPPLLDPLLLTSLFYSFGIVDNWRERCVTSLHQVLERCGLTLLLLLAMVLLKTIGIHTRRDVPAAWLLSTQRPTDRSEIQRVRLHELPLLLVHDLPLLH
jgi:hypothetical protein